MFSSSLLTSRLQITGKIVMNFNEAVDFWYYEIGVNVIHINSREKVTYVKWSDFQGNPVSWEHLNKWKTNGGTLFRSRG